MTIKGYLLAFVNAWLTCSYSLASDHLQKTVFYYVDVVRLIYPAWSPDTGVFPFSSSEAGEGFSVSATSYASNVDAGVRAMLDDDVSGDPGDDVIDDVTGGRRQVLDVAEWIGNTSTFLRVIDDAMNKVHRLVTSEHSATIAPLRNISYQRPKIPNLKLCDFW